MDTHESEAAFVKQYEGLVASVAHKTMAQLNLRCDVEDLIGFGYTGLLEARARFDASKGVPFRNFAYYRVRGAVLDGVRTMAYLPRRAYARLRAAEVADAEAESAAQATSQQSAAPAPVAAARTLDAVLGRMAAAYCVSATLQEEEGDEGGNNPELAAIARQNAGRVRAALGTLPERERFLIEGHYLKGKPFDELSAELGLSKSWGSRLHARGLDLMRKALSSA